MKILMYIHASPPFHWAGAETMIWEFGQQMMKRGHEVRCISRDAKDMVYQGVRMTAMPKQAFKGSGRQSVQRDQWFAWADVVWTHLGDAAQAKLHAERFKKPLLHLIHNTAKITPAFNRKIPQGFIFNSEAMLKAHYEHGYLSIQDLPRPYAVVRPTIDPKKYKTTEKGDRYTLINVNVNKGGWQFYQLAKNNSDWKFLGIEGMYGHQVFRDGLVMTKYVGGEVDQEIGGTAYTKVPQLKNLTFHPNTGDMVSIYNKTKILLIMSELETWGRTASEAMCNGIPVIYHHPKENARTDGLHEHVGEGGYRVYNRDDLNEWAEAIEEVNNNYDYWSQKAFDRFSQLGTDYDALENLCRYIQGKRQRTIRI